MKARIITSGLMMAAAMFLASCYSDRDYNPSIEEIPQTFKLNTPAYAEQITDLKQSSELRFTWSQPDYGFPAAVKYNLQVSLTGEYNEEVKDEKGEVLTPATYKTLEGTYTKVQADVSASNLNECIAQLSEWEDESSVGDEPVKIYVRCVSVLADESYRVISNSVALNVLPYYINVTPPGPATFFITGDAVAGWMSGDGTYGANTVPLDEIAEYSYNATTGAGDFQVTVYLLAGKGFKLVGSVASWDVQIGSAAENMELVYNEGASKNIFVPEDGFYTIKLSNKDGNNAVKASIEKAAADFTESKIYSNVYFTGLNNDWTTLIEMTPCFTNGHNHIWFGIVDATAGNTEMKFLEGVKDGAWLDNWGAADFPYGFADKGENIKVKKGKYAVYFNDLSKNYQFMPIK